MTARFTPEATIGPFYPGAFLTGFPQDLSSVAPLLAHRPQGQPMVLVARFLDSAGRPVPSLVVEFWQANAFGRYRHPDDRSSAPLDPQFDGFARLRTSDQGVLRYRTIKPGAHPVAGGTAMRAPHLRLTIFASGIDRLTTQLFFDDETLNASDPLLQSIPDRRVRERLIARKRSDRADFADTAGGGDSRPIVEYELDVVLRGDAETPFFEYR